MTSPVAARTDRARLIGTLQRATEAVLRPLLSAEQPTALLDFPAYANVGDSALWLGALQWLNTWGLPAPRYMCDLHTFTAHELARRTGRGTILLSGGGNFGDLYEHHQHFRERVVSAFPRWRIVQLPQTVRFRNMAALQRARAVLDRHPDLTILVRDERSYEVAANSFRARVELCPDLAFGLGALPRAGVPDTTELRLLRRDRESCGDVRHNGVDWPHDEPATPLAAAHRRLRRAYRYRATPLVARLLARTYAPLARQRLRRGIALLCRGERVATDRLHAHILCVLLGIPHRLHADRYGKLRDFVTQWTASSDLIESQDWIT